MNTKNLLGHINVVSRLKIDSISEISIKNKVKSGFYSKSSPDLTASTFFSK